MFLLINSSQFFVSWLFTSKRSHWIQGTVHIRQGSERQIWMQWKTRSTQQAPWILLRWGGRCVCVSRIKKSHQLPSLITDARGLGTARSRKEGSWELGDFAFWMMIYIPYSPHPFSFPCFLHLLILLPLPLSFSVSSFLFLPPSFPSSLHVAVLRSFLLIYT